MVSIVVVDVVDVGVVLCVDFWVSFLYGMCLYVVVLSCKGALLDIRIY